MNQKFIRVFLDPWKLEASKRLTCFYFFNFQISRANIEYFEPKVIFRDYYYYLVVVVKKSGAFWYHLGMFVTLPNGELLLNNNLRMIFYILNNL
jgi:hypothetical protein